MLQDPWVSSLYIFWAASLTVFRMMNDPFKGIVMSGWRPFGNVIVDGIWAWRGGAVCLRQGSVSGLEQARGLAMTFQSDP